MKWDYLDIRSMTDMEYQKGYSLMSSEKQNRIRRFRYIEDKKRTIAGEILARRMISEFCSINADLIKFETGVYGKPYALGLSVEFNISHSGDFAVCAVSEMPLGIDIEKIRPIDLKVAKRICTAKELLYIFGHTPQESDFCVTENNILLTRFFNVWVKKEAYSKCFGKAFVNSETDMTDNIPILFCNEYTIAIFQQPD